MGTAWGEDISFNLDCLSRFNAAHGKQWKAYSQEIERWCAENPPEIEIIHPPAYFKIVDGQGREIKKKLSRVIVMDCETKPCRWEVKAHIIGDIIPPGWEPFDTMRIPDDGVIIFWLRREVCE